MTNEALVAGREAIGRHDWEAALEALETAENSGGSLGPEDLVRMGDALWWTGRPDDAVEAFEKAFAGYERDDNRSEAAHMAGLLSYLAVRRRAYSIASGWMARAERLLEGQPESVGHAWIELLKLANTLLAERKLEAVIQDADEVMALAQRMGIPGVRALAMSFKGIAMIGSGDWRRGIALVDEATLVAMSGDGDLRAASDVYCNTIAACRNLADYRRAGEWTDEAERWMKANDVGGYTGVCQVHRAELKRLHGSWPEAEQEAKRACIELEKFHIMDGLGYAYYEIGEVRRRMGDLAAAEESFASAFEHGASAQPGRSLLMLERGEVEEAAKSIAAALERRSDDDSEGPPPLSRGRLLPAQVEIAIKAGDLETAKTATAELDEFAALYESPAWKAVAMSCRGSLDLAEGKFDKAVGVLEGAWKLWQEADLPYEAAQTRMLLGQARNGLGDQRAADLEYGAARSTFQKLGARTDLHRLDALLGADHRSRGEGQRETKAFMFTDIVSSTDLIGIIGDAAWENLLRWHDRVFREVLAANNGEEVKHTGDGFFASFGQARDAIECAVTMQRTLEANRRDHGFAPQVRIGIHVAEATKTGSDYAGQGVHAASRVGALAKGEQIVVSKEVLAGVGAIPYSVSDGETVTLKGLTEPVEVHYLDWH